MALPTRHSTSMMNRFDPSAIDDVQDRMSQFMRSIFPGMEPAYSAWTPMGELCETDEGYQLDLELPGVRRDDITIELHNQELSVRGEFRPSETAGHRRHSTRRTGEFEYAVQLPHAVDQDKIAATLKDGMLTVKAPKSTSAKPRPIKIQSA